MLLSSLFIPLVFILTKNTRALTSLCPNGCSGRGYCSLGSTGECKCFPSFGGPDCSQRLCPAGRAWVDFPSEDNIAHAEFTECSNMGSCNRTSGNCECRTGFGGPACEKMLCPTGVTAVAAESFLLTRDYCAGNGRCLSLRELSSYENFNTYLGYSNYNGWDADMVHGCVCNDGWEGVACDLRSCPKGDNWLTPGGDEVQLIDCSCTNCVGGVYISIGGKQTALIPADASEELIAFRLNQLPSVISMEVKILNGQSFCSAAGSTTKFTWKLPQGPQDDMVVIHSADCDFSTHLFTDGWKSVLLNSAKSERGTREYVTCSDHGICDHSSGRCNCFDGYKSSDGLGNSGSIGDCGYNYNSTAYRYAFNETVTITTCPFYRNAVCSGHGSCIESTGTCVCSAGYSGPGCSEKSCPTSKAWFGDVNDDHATELPCGGVGTCNTETGLCSDCGGNYGFFEGNACELFSCSKDAYGNTCSGKGTCMSLRRIADYSYNEYQELAGISYETPWDADKIQGCVCSRAISVDLQFDYTNPRSPELDSRFNQSFHNYTAFVGDDDLNKFYRGPYAYSATDFKGYDCQQTLCPKGDNPRTRGVNEIQELHCLANNGSFTLTFRENTTELIPYSATVEELQIKLESLHTIGRVNVYATNGSFFLTDGNNICDTYNNITVYVEFLTEFGDLPLMRSDPRLIDNTGGYSNYEGAFVMNVTEYQRGTKEDMECSGQGVCDENAGQCKCFTGFGSSNGSVSSPGQWGECSYFARILK